jgi:hypothetical protein
MSTGSTLSSQSTHALLSHQCDGATLGYRDAGIGRPVWLTVGLLVAAGTAYAAVRRRAT